MHLVEQSLLWKKCLINMDKQKQNNGAEKPREKNQGKTDATKCVKLTVILGVRVAATLPAEVPTEATVASSSGEV